MNEGHINLLIQGLWFSHHCGCCWKTTSSFGQRSTLEEVIKDEPLCKLPSAGGGVSVGWSPAWQSSVSFNAESYKHFETLQNSFEGYFCSDDLNTETPIPNSFLAETQTRKESVMQNLPKMTSLARGQRKRCNMNLTQKVFQNAGISWHKPTLIWQSKPWKIQFHSLLNTLVSQNFPHLLPSKRKVKIDFMSMMTSMLPCQRLLHNFNLISWTTANLSLKCILEQNLI